MVANDPDLGHLASPVFRPALRAWARCEARVELVAAWDDAEFAAAKAKLLA